MGADFFVKDDEFDLYNIIEEMKEQNKNRRSLEKIIYDDAMKKIEKLNQTIGELPLIILSSSRWHAGVIGVVSSRLSLKFNVPVILIAFDGDEGKASCRSVGNISIFNYLTEIKDLLVRYGGHDLAAGFVIKRENLGRVREFLLNKISSNNIENETTEIKRTNKTHDYELDLTKIDTKVFEFMEKMAPFGISNPHPLFYDNDIQLKDIKRFGVDSRHFNGYVYKNNIKYNVVGFDLANEIKEKYFLKKYSIIYYPEKIFLNDEEVIQIILKDIKEKE